MSERSSQMKRNLQRPWGCRHRQGWIILSEELAKALKDRDAVQVGEITIGAKKLYQLIKLLPSPDILIRSNGTLEVETISRVFARGRDGERRCSFRKPKHGWNYLRIFNGAWMPKTVRSLVTIKPRKYTQNRGNHVSQSV